ncbi:glycosyltransferase family 28 domain-containing protein [Rutstroemia sp. NJR-2017a BVV2]|nr:glycosyltransferase family 28 domain-containing protein [Rutstroemia sp. NJR-2017a BVV2]
MTANNGSATNEEPGERPSVTEGKLEGISENGTGKVVEGGQATGSLSGEETKQPAVPSRSISDANLMNTAPTDLTRSVIEEEPKGEVSTNDISQPTIPLRSLSSAKTHTPPAAAAKQILQDERRPNLNTTKGWATDRPQGGASPFAFSPTMRRHGTNTSMLNEAIWNKAEDVHPDDSSSSSSEDEDHAPAPKKKNLMSGKKLNNLKKDTGGRGQYNRFHVKNNDYSTKGKVSKRDGRLNISVHETSNRGYLAKALGATFFNNLDNKRGNQSPEAALVQHQRERLSNESEATLAPSAPRPKLNIVVMVIGSRGDIQPFLKLGKNLMEYGHRVRIATHPAFRDFVQKDSGLEFFSVGGDPAELMAFMVKNPGMIPKMDTLKTGEVGRRRAQMAEMFEGFWRACINATDEERDVTNLKMMGDKAPFVADAIIANPPSFAHIHCAERLGIPLHLMFTFPYTPTQAFPHPLANIKKTNVDPGYTNFMSYPLVEMMTWQGLGDLVNNFRVKTLGLEPVSTLWAPGQLYRLKVPYTYLWSPGLVPKPKDWGPEIDIAGFVFLDLAATFKPPEDLVKFLEAGEAPIYIGFGSIVVDDPDRFTEMIFEAVKKAGVRALVSKGWGGLGGDNTPDNVFMLENTPHDWLFPKVRAVVHHGGAGTTAIGLKCGKPTMIVPFFGDQQFWGSMIGNAGAGAQPVPYKDLTADKLAEGIKQCLTDSAREAVEKIAKDIEAEGDGAKNAVKSFHRSLTLRGEHSMRCSILEDRVAVWSMKGTNLRLSALAAEILVERKKITWKQLRLIRHHEWNDFEGPGEPVTGIATAAMGTVTNIATGVGSVPFKIAKTVKKRSMHEKKKRMSVEVKRMSVETKRSGNGRNSIADGNSKKSAENPRQQNQMNGIAEGQENGTAEGKEHIQPPTAESDKSAETQGLKPPGPSSPFGADLSNHTTTGAPTRQGSRPPPEEPTQPQTKTTPDNASLLSSDPSENPAEEIALDVGLGLGRTAEAIARAPMDLSLALAQGFHNAPRLYGDTTVRRPTRITGMKSGLKAAGEEFVFGIYDGVTGLVVQPYTGARDHGALGFVKGVGMGLTGFVLKDIAAVVGPFGYTLKGVHKQLVRGKQPTAFIRKARILQGRRDILVLEREGREKEKREVYEEVMHGWEVIEEVWRGLDEGEGGIKGRWKGMRERGRWKKGGALEGVGVAEEAVKVKREGRGLEGFFRVRRREIREAEGPRESVVGELERRKEGRGREEGEGNVGQEVKV